MLNWCERETNWVLNSIRFEFSSLLLALLLMLFYQLNRWKITKSKKYAFFTWTPSNVIWMKWKQHSQHSTHAHNEWAISNFGIILQTKAAATIRGYTFSHSIPILFSFSLFTRELSAFEVEKQRLQCRGAGDVFQHVNWCVPNQWAATNPKELNQNNKQANHAIASSKKKSSQSSGVKKKEWKISKDVWKSVAPWANRNYWLNSNHFYLCALQKVGSNDSVVKYGQSYWCVIISRRRWEMSVNFLAKCVKGSQNNGKNGAK